MMKRTKTHSALSALVLVTTIAASACGSDASTAEPISDVDPVVTIETPTTIATSTGGDTDEPGSGAPSRVVTAEQGAQERAQNPRSAAFDAATTSRASDSPIGDCGAPYEPSDEEIAASNADAQGLADAFDRFGIEHSAATDDTGWLIVDYDGQDVIAQSVADSYWNERFPVEGNAPGADFIVVDDVNPEVFVDLPAPSPTDLEAQNTENARLAEGLTDAGIEFEVVADELGWEWLEWDYDDPELFEAVNAVFDELYPVEILPVESCIVIDTLDGDGELGDGIGDGQPRPIDEQVEVDKPVDDFDGAEEFPIVPDEFDAADVAQRDAEVAALAQGLADAGVTANVIGESPWSTVIFDISDDAAIPVVASILAAR